MLKKFLFMLMPLMAFMACNFSTTMVVTPAKQEVPAAGASFTVSLVTTEEDPRWTVECDSAWITVKPTSGKGDGKVQVTVAKNPRKASRSAAVGFRGTTSTVYTYVLQEANDKDESGSGSGGNGGNGGNGGSGDNGGSGNGGNGDNGGTGTETYDGPYFDLGDGLKVVFAPGNLQYNPAKNEWRFAEHQYTTIGYDNDKISQTYNGWIDLFGWGTSGYRASCMPYLTSMDNEQYGPQGNYNLTDSYANYDWGVYNSSKIKNNPNSSYKWHLLQSWEWHPLMTNHQHTLATVCGVPGVMIFPKGFKVDAKEISYADYLHKVVKDEKYLTDNGILFLPCAGRREGATCKRETTGWYHTSTSKREGSTGLPKGCIIVEIYSDRDDEDGIGDFTTVGEPYGRHYGCAVRLVRDVK